MRGSKDEEDEEGAWWEEELESSSELLLDDDDEEEDSARFLRGMDAGVGLFCNKRAQDYLEWLREVES